MLRILLVLATLFVSATAFGQDIVGKWVVNLDSFAKDPKISKMTPEQRAQTLKMAQQMLGQMTVRAMKDGKAEMSMGPGASKSGTWTKDAKGGFTMTLDGQAKQVTVSGDTLSITGGTTTLDFNRVGKAYADVPPIAFVGAWALDLPATIAAAPADKTSQMKKMGQALAGMRLTFDKGTFSMASKAMSRAGTYTIAGTVGGVTVLESRETKKDHIETMRLTRVGAHLHVTVDNDTLVFAR